MLVLDEVCPVDAVVGSRDAACLVEFQALVAEAQQWPAEFTQALPVVVLFLVFGFGLMLGNGGAR